MLDCGDEPTRLLDAWAGLDLVVVVDAIRPGGAPGTLHRVEAHEGRLPAELGMASTHAFGIADTIELGRALGRSPGRVVVIGVEGASFEMGEDVSPEVEAAIDRVVEAVRAELRGEETACTRRP